MDRNKLMVNNSILLNIKTVIVIILSFLTSRYVLSLLGVEGYGLYYLVAGVTGTFEFLCSSMLGTTSRFTTLAEGKHDAAYSNVVFNTLRKNNNTITIWILLIIEVVGLLMLFFVLKIPQEFKIVSLIIYQIMVVDTYFKLKVMPYNSLLIAKENFLFINCVTIGQSVLKLSSVLLLFLVADRYRLVSYSLVITLISFIARYITIYYVDKKYDEAKIRVDVIDEDLKKEMLSYLKYSWFGSVSSVIKSQGTNLLFNIFTGLTTFNAAYGVSKQITGVNDMAFGTTAQALLPQTLKSYSENDYGRFRRLTIFNSKLAVILSYLVIIPLFVEIDFVFGIWLEVTPEYAIKISRIILVSELIRQTYNGLGMSTVASEKVKKVFLLQTIFQVVVFVSTIIILSLNNQNIFILLYADVFISFVNLLLNVVFSHKYIQISAKYYFRSVILPAFVCSLIFIPLFMYFKDMIATTLVLNLLYIFVMVLLVGMYFVFVVLSREEKDSIKVMLDSFRKRIVK